MREALPLLKPFPGLSCELPGGYQDRFLSFTTVGGFRGLTPPNPLVGLGIARPSYAAYKAAYLVS